MARLSTPMRSFLSSRSFWKFSILKRVPWSCTTISEISASAAGTDKIHIHVIQKEVSDTWQYKSNRSRTSRVSEVVVCRWIVFAEALQDLFIVHEAVQRPQEEDVEWQVTDLLKLKVSAQTLQLSGRATRPFQLQQRLWMLLKMSCQQLRSQRETVNHLSW